MPTTLVTPDQDAIVSEVHTEAPPGRAGSAQEIRRDINSMARAAVTAADTIMFQESL